MEIMTTKQASGLWSVSEMCRGGRIEGAYKIGTAWVMPADTEKPKDERITTGKWVGYKRRDKEGQQ